MEERRWRAFDLAHFWHLLRLILRNRLIPRSQLLISRRAARPLARNFLNARALVVDHDVSVGLRPYLSLKFALLHSRQPLENGRAPLHISLHLDHSLPPAECIWLVLWLLERYCKLVVGKGILSHYLVQIFLQLVFILGGLWFLMLYLLGHFSFPWTFRFCFLWALFQRILAQFSDQIGIFFIVGVVVGMLAGRGFLR